MLTLVTRVYRSSSIAIILWFFNGSTKSIKFGGCVQRIYEEPIKFDEQFKNNEC